MDQNGIENIAINALKAYFEYSNNIVTNFFSNDKTPALDGSISVYDPCNNEQKSKKNHLYDIKVQIKGTTRKLINDKYSVKIDDLQFYKNDNIGLIYFVIFVDQANRQEKIYYKNLSPLAVNTILNDTNNKKNINLGFKEMPSEVNNFIDTMRLFQTNLDHQGKSVIVTGQNVSLSETTPLFAYRTEKMEQNLKLGDNIDFYAELDDINKNMSLPIPVAVGILKKVIGIYNLTIKNSCFETKRIKIFIDHQNNTGEIHLESDGKCNLDFKILNSKLNAKFLSLEGTLKTRLTDLRFIHSLFDGNFKILFEDGTSYLALREQNAIISFLKQLFPKIESNIADLQDFINFLRRLMINTDFDPQKINKISYNNLLSMFKFNKSPSKKINVRTEIHINEDYYGFIISNNKIFNLLSKEAYKNLVLSQNVNGKSIIMNPYMILDKNLEHYPNFKNSNVIKSFSKDDYYNKDTIETYIKYTILLLNTYLCKKQDKCFLDIVERILQKIYKYAHSDSDLNFIFLNRLLLKKIKNKSITTNNMIKLLKINSSDKLIENRFFALGLLNSEQEIYEILDNLDKDKKERLLSSPIGNYLRTNHIISF